MPHFVPPVAPMHPQGVGQPLADNPLLALLGQKYKLADKAWELPPWMLDTGNQSSPWGDVLGGSSGVQHVR